MSYLKLTINGVGSFQVNNTLCSLLCIVIIWFHSTTLLYLKQKGVYMLSTIPQFNLQVLYFDRKNIVLNFYWISLIIFIYANKLSFDFEALRLTLCIFWAEERMPPEEILLIETNSSFTWLKRATSLYPVIPRQFCSFLSHITLLLRCRARK